MKKTTLIRAIRVALFIVGCLAAMRAFGEAHRDMSFTLWALNTAISASVAFGCFYAMKRLHRITRSLQ